MIDPDQSTRSAITVAGISGNSASSARTLLSNGENDVGAGLRSYLGGTSDETAFTTVVREIPRRDAIRAFGTPSAASLRINAQSSKVITLQSLSVHFPSVATVQFSSVVDNGPFPGAHRAHDQWGLARPGSVSRRPGRWRRTRGWARGFTPAGQGPSRPRIAATSSAVIPCRRRCISGARSIAGRGCGSG